MVQTRALDGQTMQTHIQYNVNGSTASSLASYSSKSEPTFTATAAALSLARPCLPDAETQRRHNNPLHMHMHINTSHTHSAHSPKKTHSIWHKQALFQPPHEQWGGPSKHRRTQYTPNRRSTTPQTKTQQLLAETHLFSRTHKTLVASRHTCAHPKPISKTLATTARRRTFHYTAVF